MGKRRVGFKQKHCIKNGGGKNALKLASLDITQEVMKCQGIYNRNYLHYERLINDMCLYDELIIQI